MEMNILQACRKRESKRELLEKFQTDYSTPMCLDIDDIIRE